MIMGWSWDSNWLVIFDFIVIAWDSIGDKNMGFSMFFLWLNGIGDFFGFYVSFFFFFRTGIEVTNPTQHDIRIKIFLFR